MTIDIFTNKNEYDATIGSKIRALRKSLKMTQKQFAESLGIVQGFLSAIEKGRKSPSYTLLVALQHLYRVNLDGIPSENSDNKLSKSIESVMRRESLAMIPLLNKLPSDHAGLQDSTGADRYISLPEVPTDCVAFEYKGDYMSPTIRDGDIIIIKSGKILTSGNIGLIVGKWGEPLLRRYREINGEAYFSPDNSTYSSFQPDASTIILGVVVKVWREINI